jgi:hypothetical protein
MKNKNYWLFEAPFITDYPKYYPFNNRSLQEIERQLEQEWESPEVSYVNYELEEEYRRHNRRFRREMAAKIGSQINHPLQFLIKRIAGKYIFRRAKERRIDAGHITPVITLKKRGYLTERLAIQDRQLNRRDGAQMRVTGKGKRIQVLDIAGIPVDKSTVEKYVKKGLLAPKWLRAKLHKGWKAPTDKELFFAIAEFD